MRDILLKRNELRSKSVHLKSMKFDNKIDEDRVDEIVKTQNEIYNKWNFYDKFIKAREGVKKSEIKLNNVGKTK